MGAVRRIPPHNDEAEECIVGACLVRRDAVEVAGRLVAPSDFYSQPLGQIFNSIVSLYSEGIPIDSVTVHADLKQRKVTQIPNLDSLAAGIPSASLVSLKRYVGLVLTASAARRAIGLASEALAALYDGADPYEASEELSRDLSTIDRVGDMPEGFSSYGSFMDSEEADAPWVIPGLVYADTRVVITAGGGAGKSTVLRQLSWCAAMGVHPFTFRKIEPVRCLVLDFENPRRELRTTGHRLRHHLKLSPVADYDESRVGLWRRPQGANIRDRRIRGQLEAVLEEMRPQLVVGGPVYKMSRKKSGENYEEVADATHEILDDMRIRHGFALILEHHATIGKNGGGERDLRAFGGQRWEAWPDLAIALRQRKDGVHLERPSREDRGQFHWPDIIRRGSVWPWEAVTKEGMPDDDPGPNDPGDF